MSTDMKDIENLLASILNDEEIPLPPVEKAVVNTIANSGKAAIANAAEAVSDEDFLSSIMSDEVTQGVNPDPGDTQGGGEGFADVSAAPGIFADTEARTNAVQAMKMPTFTADDFAETMDIRNLACLVTLQTTRWHAKVKDRQASKDAATMGEADENAFETRKRLLVGADDKLRAIHKIIDEARACHYDMTLPWTTTGMNDIGRRTGGRLLPNTLFVEYTSAMAKFLQRMNEALDAFVPEYPAMIAKAQTKLGKRFDPREYPNTSSIRSHFNLSFDFQPIPKGEDFGGLPQVQLDMLAKKINENTRVMAENAMQELWTRLLDVVGRMAERLSSPDKLFQNSLVQNVRDTARLMAHLNITGDPRVEALRAKVEKQLCQHDAKDLREKPVLRAKVGAMAQSILEEMNR